MQTDLAQKEGFLVSNLENALFELSPAIRNNLLLYGIFLAVNRVQIHGDISDDLELVALVLFEGYRLELLV